MKIKTASEKETEELGRKIASRISPRKKGATKIFLKGDLGSGKTTFVKGFARHFDLKEITSPTFVVMKRYPIEDEFLFLYHLDFYRLEEGDRLGDLEMEAIFEKRENIVLIEWPEKGGFEEEATVIKFKFVSEKEREIKVPNNLLD